MGCRKCLFPNASEWDSVAHGACFAQTPLQSHRSACQSAVPVVSEKIYPLAKPLLSQWVAVSKKNAGHPLPLCGLVESRNALPLREGKAFRLTHAFQTPGFPVTLPCCVPSPMRKKLPLQRGEKGTAQRSKNHGVEVCENRELPP